MVEVCQRIDIFNGKRCTKIAQKEAVDYFGERELYSSEGVWCVRVYLCPTHMSDVRGGKRV